ncbi:MAG TPA: hypothetical protein VF844_19230 [Ktedonobacteraceae bacterium]
MHETLSSLVARAFTGNQRPLEFYLREQSRLPGARANLELVSTLSSLLTAVVPEQPDQVWMLLNYLVRDEKTVGSNTPDEFIVLCGVVAFGACATVRPEWHIGVFELLGDFASSSAWRVREGVAMAFQRLLPAAPQETIEYLMEWARKGNCFQQRASIVAIADPALLHTQAMIDAALTIQRLVLERLHALPAAVRKREDVRVLRQALGYTLSVVAAATPEKGFALMRECAGWGDLDVNWILRENLKKKRLAKFTEHAEKVSRLLA